MTNVSVFLKNQVIYVTLFALLSSVFAYAQDRGAGERGGANGGGGFQYPNSKALLKKVSTELADDIAKMDPKAFVNFPNDLNQDKIAQLIRDVKYLYDTNEERLNPDGEYEGLMFNFYRNFGGYSGGQFYTMGYAIAALQPFFETYRALPMKQLAVKKFDSELYKLTHNDLRQKLLHEVGHFLGIGVGVKDDGNGDIFADRILKAQYAQYVRCETTQWQKNSSGQFVYLGVLLHRATGKMGIVGNHYSSTSTAAKPDFHSPDPYSSDFLQQMEKNGPVSEGTVFDPTPFPSALLWVRASFEYQIMKDKILWRETPFDSTTSTVDEANIDLKNGVGTLIYDSITFPMKCGTVSPVIDYSDLVTKR